MTFVSTDPPSHSGKTTTWLTPLPLLKQLGEFDLDPCGFEGHHTAKKIICPPSDGLVAAWNGRIWLNPPYGKEQQGWMSRMQEHGNGVALIFARLETRWIQPFLKNGFFIIQGRIAFLNDRKEKSSNAGSASMLIPFGRKNIGSILISDIEGRWYQ